MSDAKRLHLQGQIRGIPVDHYNPWIIRELSFQISGKGGIQFEQQQACIRPHSARNLPRMHSFAGAVLRNYLCSFKIDFSSYSLDKRPRTRHNRGDLEWPLQKTFEKQRIHRSTNSSPAPLDCPVATTPKFRGKTGFRLCFQPVKRLKTMSWR